MNAYAPRYSDTAVRGALVAMADAVEQRLVAGQPPMTPIESRQLFYDALGLTPEQVAAGFAAADSAWRTNPHKAAKGNAASRIGVFFTAARAVPS